jgi:TRAP-type C4-dicarboxylate transport system permease small subunit
MSRQDGTAGRAGWPAPEGPLEKELAIGGPLGALTRGLAFVGGAFLLVAIVITLVSVGGRYAFGTPVPGDYELVELTCAIGVFLFFPYTHSVSGNITAEFFTAGISARKRRLLDIGNDVVFTLVAMLITWRLSLGLLEKFATGETSILIRIPLWWAYSVAVASMALLSLVCLARVVVGIGSLRR